MTFPWWVLYMLSFDFAIRLTATGVFAVGVVFLVGVLFRLKSIDIAVAVGLSATVLGLLLCIWTW